MSTYEISKSSLLSLKAEILRKQEELGKVKLQNKSKLAQQAKKNTPLDLKNRGVSQRESNDTAEDDDLLKKSRTVLEAKTKLYDQLSKGVNYDEETNTRYLVRFDKKQRQNLDLPPEEPVGAMDVDMHPDSDEERHFSDEYDPATDPGDEWVDYIDCLGRTRKCLRKDLDYIKEKDSDLKSTIKTRRKSDHKDVEELEINRDEEPQEEYNEESELLSGDMRRELLRKQWEREEEELCKKSDIHYQDILFDEARTHGVGYYGFSKDEEERARQQEALKKLRAETQEQQRKAEELKTMREKQLSARMKAARNRKRARMGLPPEEDEPEQSVTRDEEEAKLPEKTQAELEIEKEKEVQRQRHVRPWDLGKEGVKEHIEYSQEDWVKKQRNQRDREFAPPTSYANRRRKDLEDTHDESKAEKSLYFTTKKSSRGKDEFRIDTSKPPPRINNPSKRRLNPYKTEDDGTAEHRREQFEPVPIADECVDFDEEQDRLLQDYLGTRTTRSESGLSGSDSNEDERGRGTEIAPPPTFEYYGPSGGKRSKREGVGAASLEQSISAGLQFLRQQVEKKKKSTKHPREMFLL